MDDRTKERLFWAGAITLGAGAVAVVARAASKKKSAASLPVVGDTSWPPPPAGLRPLVTNEERFAAFGRFNFVPAPTANNPGGIQIQGDWIAHHIVTVTVPELVGISGAPPGGRIPFYKEGAAQLLAMFRAWKDAGLIDRILTWNGSWNPRFVRGSTSYLSNHAFATAFDINAQWNPFGAVPAPVGAKGSVRELAAMAPDFGFYWGGWYKDGMHFELAQLQTPNA
jgi:hypothetical protein